MDESMILQVGDGLSAANSSWNFAGNNARSFDNHVTRSVPLYAEGHDLVVKLSDFFLANGSICYELGCSTGILTRKLAEWNKQKQFEIVGIDKEKDMVEIARENCKTYPGVTILQEDVVEYSLKKCDLVVAYYTMQFVRPRVRQLLFNKIYEALNWGGAFLCFEKVRASDARFQDIMTALYTDFKLDQGYTPDEIIAKSRSLKGVLEPFSQLGNIDLMKRAGFVDIMTVMKFTCFEGFLAIK